MYLKQWQHFPIHKQKTPKHRKKLQNTETIDSESPKQQTPKHRNQNFQNTETRNTQAQKQNREISKLTLYYELQRE